MSENNNPRKKLNFRAALHLISGILYIVVAGLLMKWKKFGAIDLGTGTSYALGALLIVYGAFRIWRGWQDMKVQDYE